MINFHVDSFVPNWGKEKKSFNSVYESRRLYLFKDLTVNISVISKPFISSNVLKRSIAY